MSVIECFSFASVLLLAWVSGTVSQSLPSIPEKYHVIVSANIVEKGYTLAYEEWYDGSLSMMRSDGRFSSPSVTQLVFQNATESTLTTYTIANTSSLSPTCIVSPLSASPPGLQTFSVQQLFSNFNLSSSVYLGTAPSLIRGIDCNMWQLNITSEFAINFTFTTNFYYSKPNSVQPTQLPVRIEVYGTWNSVPFTHTYSFVAWSLSYSSSSIFAIPSSLTCTRSSMFPSSLLSSLPETSSVGPPPSSNAAIPALVTTSFQAWIETKVATPAALTSSLVLSSLSSVHYVFDMPNTTSTRKERVDFTSQYGQSVSILAQYQAMTDSTHLYGEQWTTVNSVCTNVSIISNLNASPASIADVGIISSFFVDSSLLSTAVYAGRQVTRGINCDVWNVMIPSFTSASTGVTYTQLLVSFFFFPTGWQFPGRNFPSTFHPLAAINLNGNYATSNTAFTSGWDIVFLQTIDDTVLNKGGDPTLYANLQMPTACTNMTNSLFATTTAAAVVEVQVLSSAGVAVAVVIGVIAGLVVLFAVSRYWNKKRIEQQEKFRRTENSVENPSL